MSHCDFSLNTQIFIIRSLPAFVHLLLYPFSVGLQQTTEVEGVAPTEVGPIFFFLRIFFEEFFNVFFLIFRHVQHLLRQW